MYKVEIFSDKMKFVSAVLANESQTIDLDYLSYNPYSIQTEIVDCKKGYFVHISSVEDNRYVADGIVSDVQPDKFTQKISIRPLQALFDADIFSTRITDCVTWIKDAITSIFISNSDTLQNRPIKLTYTKPSKDLPLTESFDETSNDTFNILSVISSALKHYNVVTACYLDMKNMQIRVRIYQNKETKTIEGDLENVIKSDATLGDSYGSINKVVVRRFINLASGYLSCDTEAAQRNKVISVSNDFVVEEGGFYAVRFSEDVPAESSLIFSTRAESDNDPVIIANLPIYYAGAPIPSGAILGGLTALFVDLDGKANLIELVNDDSAYCYIIGYTSFFRDINGKISDSVKKKNRIVPVFVRHISIEQPSDMSYMDWYIEALTQSVEILTPEQYDQEIQLTYHINDKIVNPLDMSIGTVTTIHYKGETYTSIYAEKKLKGNLITLVFGAVRTDLTKKLSNKTGGGTTSSGGYTGSSGGGGGGETGTTNYNQLSNKPSINDVTLSGNKTLSDLGIPTTYGELSGKPSINGTTLSGNKTAAELGLQNELTAGNMVAISNDTVSAVIPFAEADATSRTVFTATVPTIRSLEDGAAVLLLNTSGYVSNTDWTLNVNGLGALHVFNSMSRAKITTQFAANATYLFTYDSSLDDGSGGWYMYTGYNSDTNTQAYLIRNYNASLVMKNTLYRYMICFTDHDGLLVPSANSNNSTSVTKALTTDSFDPFGDIYYYSTTAIVDPGASPNTSYMWKMRNDCNMRYGWNISTTDLELKAPVYVRCVPQSDGQVKLDGNDCIVQALPTTEDGKVYIYLGRAYSGYQMELYFTHPVYYYKDGAIRTWDAGDYSAGNGIAISNQEISIADLIIDCGSSTVNVGV